LYAKDTNDEVLNVCSFIMQVNKFKQNNPALAKFFGIK